MAEPHAPRLPCPVEGCDHEHPPEHAMCSDHWRMVPRGIQRRVYRTWRDRRRPNAGTRELRAHLQALEDAVASVEGREARELFNDPAAPSAPRHPNGEGA